jgi:hypothetical protein
MTFLCCCVPSTPDSLHPSDRLSNFEVHVGSVKPSNETIGSNPLCTAVEGALPGGPTRLTCAEGVMGRYLSIALRGAEALHICEVTVEHAEPTIGELRYGTERQLDPGGCK